MDAYSMLENKLWHDGGVFAEDCANAPGNADIAPFLNTPFVARDMLEIIDAIGEDKLQYWGISYGTILGQTFAGMFPDRIERMVLDSNFRLDDYYAGQWITPMRDTERSLLNFFTECVNIGPEICTIANFTGPETTAEDLHNEYAKIIQELIDEPVFMPDDYQFSSWIQPGGYPVVQDVKFHTYTQLYRPSQFPVLNMKLSIAFERDWERWFATSTTSAPEKTAETSWSLSEDGFHGIACVDGAFRADKPEDMYSFVQAQASAGPFADTFSPQMWACAQWKFEAKERYTGPYTAINTSYPILFVNGNHDPVTPLSSTYEVSANFPRSRVLVQNGHGHAVRSHPSKCTYTAIAKYFNDGEFPPVGTVCETDLTYYGVYEALLAAQQGNSTTDGTAEKRSFVFEI
jgi:pimeloyl-ACP methyl ester carboxylesterase